MCSESVKVLEIFAREDPRTPLVEGGATTDPHWPLQCHLMQLHCTYVLRYTSLGLGEHILGFFWVDRLRPLDCGISDIITSLPFVNLSLMWARMPTHMCTHAGM